MTNKDKLLMAALAGSPFGIVGMIGFGLTAYAASRIRFKKQLHELS